MLAILGLIIGFFAIATPEISGGYGLFIFGMIIAFILISL